MGIFRRFLFIIVILLIFFFAYAGIVGSGKPEVSMITPILFFLMMIAVILFIPVIRSAQREEKARKAEKSLDDRCYEILQILREVKDPAASQVKYNAGYFAKHSLNGIDVLPHCRHPIRFKSFPHILQFFPMHCW